MNKVYIYFIVILFSLLFAALACSVLGEDSVAPSMDLPADVLFQDDFSDPSSGWDRIQADEGITDYEDGYYRILVIETEMDVWANPGLSFTDVVIEVDATKVGGPDDNDLGVICRYQDMNNYYFFIISSDGYYGIGKVINGEQMLIGTNQMFPDEVIKQGNATNHIQADCIGSHLVLHINGKKLTDTLDTDFASGDVGLLAGTFAEPGTDIHFDNFVVRKP
jgi:hypothetical protein